MKKIFIQFHQHVDLQHHTPPVSSEIDVKEGSRYECFIESNRLTLCVSRVRERSGVKNIKTNCQLFFSSIVKATREVEENGRWRRQNQFSLKQKKTLALKWDWFSAADDIMGLTRLNDFILSYPPLLSLCSHHFQISNLINGMVWYPLTETKRRHVRASLWCIRDDDCWEIRNVLIFLFSQFLPHALLSFHLEFDSNLSSAHRRFLLYLTCDVNETHRKSISVVFTTPWSFFCTIANRYMKEKQQSIRASSTFQTVIYRFSTFATLRLLLLALFATFHSCFSRSSAYFSRCTTKSIYFFDICAT